MGPRTRGALAAATTLALSRPVAAEPEAIGLTLTPFLGLVSESDFVSGTVRFSDGDVEVIELAPDTGLQLGLQLGVPLTERLTGVARLSVTGADVAYVEGDNVRPTLGMSTLRLQPGVLARVVSSGKVDVGVGGGLTIARIGFDEARWNDNVIEVSALALGVFGAAALDVWLSDRIAFHAQLQLELSQPSLGTLRAELARADGEADATIDGDLRTALNLALGVTIAL